MARETHQQLVRRADELLDRANEHWGRPDIFDLFQHLLCETKFFTLETAAALA
jgi:hypothetical protein